MTYKKIIRLTFISYFSIIFFNLSSSLFSDYFKRKTNNDFFKIPIFQQSWNMFSPPPKSNTKFFYRIHEYKNSNTNLTEWFDIMQALHDKKRSSWFIGATSSDLSYLLYNSIQDVEDNLANCYSLDSLTIEVVNECNKNTFFGDSLIIKYINQFHLQHNKLKFINPDSLKIEYKLVEDYFPSYNDRKKDYYNLTNHTIQFINRPISKIFPVKKNIGIQLYMFIIIGTIISDMIYYYPLSESLFGNGGMITISENILSSLFKFQGTIEVYIMVILTDCIIYIFFDKFKFYSLLILYILLLERNTFILDSSSEIISLTIPFVIIIHFFETFAGKSSVTKTIFKLSRLGIMMQICIVYLFSFLYKMNDTVWLKGIATYYTLRIDSYLMSDFNIFLTKYAFFIKTSTYFTLLTELLLPFLVWFKKTKTIILLCGFFLHIGIYIFMRIEDFSWIMIASYFIFYTDNEYTKIFKKIKFLQKSGQM